MRKFVKEWKEPWKKGEPGARLSSKAQKDQKNFEKQRAQMDKRAAQKVVIICNRHLYLVNLFTSFTVKVKNPLTQQEISERMSKAFPNLTWEEK